MEPACDVGKEDLIQQEETKVIQQGFNLQDKEYEFHHEVAQ